jgi:hypothetical protein
MRTIFILFILTLMSCNKKYFEGKIEYNVIYQGLVRGETYFIKDGNYLIVFDDTTNSGIKKEERRKTQWRLYQEKTNKIYIKKHGNDTIYTFSASSNYDTIAKIIHTKGGKISGTETPKIKFKGIKFECTDGEVYLYGYNRKYKVKPNAFKNHQFLNLDVFVTKTGTFPLTMSYHIKDFDDPCDKFLSKITVTKLDSTIFELPKGKIIFKETEN